MSVYSHPHTDDRHTHTHHVGLIWVCTGLFQHESLHRLGLVRHTEVQTPSKQQWVLVNALLWSVAVLVSLVNSFFFTPLANDSVVVGDVFLGA